MARNSERAMLLLNRWQALSSIVVKNRSGDRLGIDRVTGRAPKAATLSSLSDAEYWRNATVRELSLKFVELQNPLLEEVKLADLNEHVDQLVREKLEYEGRIVALGGPDYRTRGNDLIRQNCVTTIDGKRYYGRAKELISDKDLIPGDGDARARPPRSKLVSRVNGSYFQDNVEQLHPTLLREEAAAELALRAARDAAPRAEQEAAAASAGLVAASP